MMNKTIFYGFQFPHHGEFSAFNALKGEFKKNDVSVIQAHFPALHSYIPKFGSYFYSKWFEYSELKLKKHFKNNNNVHYFFPENSLFNGHKWKRKGNLILSCHQPVDQLPLVKKLKNGQSYFDALKTADIVVLMSSVEISDYKILAPNSDVIYIPHGVDINFFNPNTAVSKNDSKNFKLLTVGNWLRDYDLWLEVVNQLKIENINIEFTIIANPQRTNQLKEKIGNQNNIRLLSNISDEDLRNEYLLTDAVFLPLINAWANNALLETMACGKHLVVTDLPATREYAGDAALYIKKGSVSDAFNKIISLINNKQDFNDIGLNARKRAEEQLSWESVSKKYIELYESF